MAFRSFALLLEIGMVQQSPLPSICAAHALTIGERQYNHVPDVRFGVPLNVWYQVPPDEATNNKEAIHA
ncbi:hypothetical protein [Ardenticatena maritima]|uniref:hypothetical protein n=1 Tax=Ardenticatena maritima TaxID=872965 RepID=UPI0013791DF5|nr:hypothetical protein [Ardenticatena maritima]